MKIIRIAPMEFQLDVKSPFVLCFHHKDFYPQGDGKGAPVYYLEGRRPTEDFNHHAQWRMYYGQTVPGFPVHPHRGFETITVMLDGFADHFDSKGSKGRYGKGDVQWMTAGAGVQHSEMFPLLSEEGDNTMHMFQIWLNLPAKDKFVEPDYKMFWDEKIPVIEEKDSEGRTTKIRLIAGSHKGTNAIDPPSASWAFDRENKVNIWIIDMDPEAEFVLPRISPTINRMLYLYEGEGISIEDQAVPRMHFAELFGDRDILLKNKGTRCKIMLLEGEPINEEVAAYGPFVMTTREEVQQAFTDYEETEFGGWIWDRKDPINPVEEGRFASYLNGERVERP